MDDFFGGFRHSQKSNFVQGNDCRIKVSFTLNEAFNGADKKVKYYRMDVCPECNGNGYGANGSKESCIHCNGTGRVRNVTRNGYATFVQETLCPYCKGYGFSIKNPCNKCNGTGAAPSSNEIDLKIPIGIFDGAEMVISGGGDAPIITSNEKGINGDLIVTFVQAKDEIFTRTYDDIYSNIKIDISDALCGSEVEVESIDGSKIKFKVPKLTKDGHMFRFNGKGMKNIKNNNYRGNHMVKICYNYPQSLTEEQENLLTKFNEIEKNKN
jgi:molecular chaperone DnaJ